MSIWQFTEQTEDPGGPKAANGLLTGRFYVKRVGGILKPFFQDSNDVVSDFEGTPGAAQPAWVLSGGVSAVSAGTTKIASMGHDNSIAGITVFRNGRILGLSVTMTLARTAGTLDFNALINGVIQNGAGETVTIDATNTISNFLIMATPIDYSAGDIIELQTSTTGFSPTGSDATLAVWVEDR